MASHLHEEQEAGISFFFLLIPARSFGGLHVFESTESMDTKVPKKILMLARERKRKKEVEERAEFLTAATHSDYYYCFPSYDFMVFFTLSTQNGQVGGKGHWRGEGSVGA